MVQDTSYNCFIQQLILVPGRWTNQNHEKWNSSASGIQLIQGRKQLVTWTHSLNVFKLIPFRAFEWGEGQSYLKIKLITRLSSISSIYFRTKKNVFCHLLYSFKLF